MELSDLDWEVRQDGVYLTIDETLAEPFLQMDLFELFQQSGYMNADVKRIQEVMKAARNTPEFVGPKFLIFNKRKEPHLILEVKPGKVFLTIHSAHADDNLSITTKDIEFLLTKKKIIHGVNWSVISKVLSLKKWDETVLVAENTLPIKGDDCRILEFIKLDKESKPLLLNDGSVDFRNLDNIIQVKKDQLLARRIPPKAGINGTDIFGNSIHSDAGENQILPRGVNTIVNEDMSELTAECSGYLFRDGPNLSIGKLFLVPGDVNFKVGNIRYQGDVVIRGSVLPDFIVEADGNIEVHGSVDGATLISTNGSVSVSQGFFGKGKGSINAKKSIKLTQAQDASIDCEGPVLFDTSLADSKINAHSVIGKSASTVIKNCTIKANHTVYSSQIGVPSGGLTTIHFINKEENTLQAQIQDLYGKRIILNNQQEGLLRHLKSMKKILEKATEISQRSQDEVKKVYLQYQSSKTKLELLDKRIASLNKRKKEAPNFNANIRAKLIHSKLSFEMRGQSQDVIDPIREVCFYWNDNKICKRADEGKVPTQVQIEESLKN